MCLELIATFYMSSDRWVTKVVADILPVFSINFPCNISWGWSSCDAWGAATNRRPEWCGQNTAGRLAETSGFSGDEGCNSSIENHEKLDFCVFQTHNQKFINR